MKFQAVILSILTVIAAAATGSAAERPEADPEGSSGQATRLPSQLSSAIQAPGWGQDHWSVLVVSLDGGDTLYSLQPDRPVPPASNLKLFTTAAALETLGPEFRYTTFLTGGGPVRDSTLEGDLFVYGTGDPTLSARFFDSKTTVWEMLADSLKAAGVTRVSGDLVADASYFEGPAIGEGWSESYVTHTYAAPASALSYNDNIVTMRVTAAEEVGAPPRVQFIPGGAVELENRAKTTGSGRGRIRLERSGYGEPLVLKGEIRKGAGAQWRAVPVTDPPAYAISVFREVLEEKGITVAGGQRVIQSAEASPITGQEVFAPVSEEDPILQVLAVHRSPPLIEILKVINQRSHNLYADAVLRTVGRVAAGKGSASGGEAVVRSMLAEGAGTADSLRMDDGSGLSRLNRTTARSLVDLLAYMDGSPHAEAFRSTLPEAATSRGLRRMHRTAAAGNLRAKTGTIEGVSALSGYVSSKTGEEMAFAILSSDVPSTWKAKRVEDRIGARLASLDRPVPRRVVAEAEAPDPPATAGGRAQEEPAGDTAAIAGAATPSPSRDTTAERRDSARASLRSYVIKPGDTLEAIAREHDTTVRAIREANPGVRDRRLIPGRTLDVPTSPSGG